MSSGIGQCMGRFREFDAQMVAVADLVARFARLAVDQHGPGLDGVLNGGPAEIAELQGQVLIEPHALLLDAGVEFERALRGEEAARGDVRFHRRQVIRCREHGL